MQNQGVLKQTHFFSVKYGQSSYSSAAVYTKSYGTANAEGYDRYGRKTDGAEGSTEKAEAKKAEKHREKKLEEKRREERIHERHEAAHPDKDHDDIYEELRSKSVWEENELDYTCGISDDELTQRFIESVRIDEEIRKIKGLPTSGYDTDLKKAYLLYPDGRKEYV